MGAGSRGHRVGSLLCCLALLGGCAAPQQAAKGEEKKPPPVSVYLPVMETKDFEARSQPPVVQPQLNPTDVDDGIHRSLNMVEIHFNLGKPPRPPEAGPPDNLGGP